MDNICDMKWFLRILRFLYCLLKEELITDWIEILITFRSACYFCRNEISPGQAFWSNSAKAAKHMGCKRTKAGSVITNEIETLQHKMSDDPIPSWANHPQIIDLKCFLCKAKPVVMNACIWMSVFKDSSPRSTAFVRAIQATAKDQEVTSDTSKFLYKTLKLKWIFRNNLD